MSPFTLLAGFTHELSRRRVFRVAVAYAAGSWLIAQVASTFFPPLGIPDWSLSLLALLLVLGFPVALGLAWAFDLTPEGVRRTPAASAAAAQATSPAAAAVRSTLPAVLALPVVDRSAEREHQYLGDGITDELIGALARVPGVQVVSRTTAFAVRGAQVDVRELGSRLGITHVLEGSLRLAGGQLRLAVQLADAESGFAVWSQSFDRLLDDVFTVHEEIARAVASALGPAVRPAASGAEPDTPLPSSTLDFEAYGAYLRGRQRWNERTPGSLRRALQLFQEAVQRDPRYAHAHAGIADCWSILVDHGIVSPAEGLAPARAAAATALALRPDLAEAQTSAALVAQLEGRTDVAEAGFRAALQRTPSYCVARHRLALLLAWQGRFDEAREQMRQARRADPLSALVVTSMAWIEYFAGRYAEAAGIVETVLAEHPGFAAARLPLALALSASGRRREAVAVARAARDAGGNAAVLGILGYVLGRAGRTAAAHAVLTELGRMAASGYVPHYVRAQVWAGLGSTDEAVAQLLAAHAERSPQLGYLSLDPVFESLRDDPRLTAISAAVGAAA